MRFLASLGMTGNTVIPNEVRNLRMTEFAWFHRRHGGDGSFTLN